MEKAEFFATSGTQRGRVSDVMSNKWKVIEDSRIESQAMNLTKTTAIALLSIPVMCVCAVLLAVAVYAQSTRVAPIAREAVPAVLDLFEQYAIEIGRAHV